MEEKHSLRPLIGNLIVTYTRTAPAKQTDTFSHTVEYHVDHLHRRDNKSLGMIMCKEAGNNFFTEHSRS